jgi:hypothetical protein
VTAFGYGKITKIGSCSSPGEWANGDKHDGHPRDGVYRWRADVTITVPAENFLVVLNFSGADHLV